MHTDTRTQLLVQNLPYRVRWQDLKDLMRKCGTVLRTDVALTRDNRSEGYGYVLFSDVESALRAINMYDGFTWQTRVLRVSLDRGDATVAFDDIDERIIEEKLLRAEASVLSDDASIGTSDTRASALSRTSSPPKAPSSNGSGTSYNTTKNAPISSGVSVSSNPSALHPNWLTANSSHSPLQTPSLAQTSPRISQNHASPQIPPQNQNPSVYNTTWPQMYGQSYPDGYYPWAHGHELQHSLQHSRSPSPNSEARRIVSVSNLPFSCNWQDLKDLMRAAGPVLRADVHSLPDGRRTGQGTIVFATPAAAANAVAIYHNAEFQGRQLRLHAQDALQMPYPYYGDTNALHDDYAAYGGGGDVSQLQASNLQASQLQASQSQASQSQASQSQASQSQASQSQPSHPSHLRPQINTSIQSTSNSSNTTPPNESLRTPDEVHNGMASLNLLSPSFADEIDRAVAETHAALQHEADLAKEQGWKDDSIFDDSPKSRRTSPAAERSKPRLSLNHINLQQSMQSALATAKATLSPLQSRFTPMTPSMPAFSLGVFRSPTRASSKPALSPGVPTAPGSLPTSTDVPATPGAPRDRSGVPGRPKRSWLSRGDSRGNV